jgi:NADP-reducing hydrogenase subunit HndB
MKTFLEAIDRYQLQVTIQQTGCIGMCIHEPIVEIIDKEGVKTTYLEVTAVKALEIIESHLKQGKVLEAYTHVTK